MNLLPTIQKQWIRNLMYMNVAFAVIVAIAAIIAAITDGPINLVVLGVSAIFLMKCYILYPFMDKYL